MGVAYGNDLAVNVPEAKVPVVTTDSVGNVGAASAVVYATITDNGNLALIERGVVVDTLENPTVDNKLVLSNETTDSYVTNVTGLKKTTHYYARAYAKNAQGIAYGDNIEFTTAEGFACGSNITDIEGNSYRTVQIGEQCWMQENMRTKTMPDGREMQALSTSVPNFTTDTRYYYERTDTIVGHVVLYPWGTVNDISSGGQSDQDAKIQGICPDGWHVPTYKQFADMCNVIDPEWDRGTLTSSTGSYSLPSNNKLAIKLTDPNCQWVNYGENYSLLNNPTYTTVENTPGYNCGNHIDDPDANSSGFSATVSGYWKNGSYFYNGCLVLWTSVGSSPTGAARTVKIASDNTGILHQSWSSTAREGYAVRCVWDGEESGGEDPEEPEEECTGHLTIDGDGWGINNTATVTIDGESTSLSTFQLMSYDNNFTFKTFQLVLTTEDLSIPIDGERCHFLIDGIDGVEPFASEQHTSECSAAKMITISLKCGDTKFTVKYEQEAVFLTNKSNTGTEYVPVFFYGVVGVDSVQILVGSAHIP